MSTSDTCATLLELVALYVWQFLQSAEGGQLLASFGGMLLILYYLRKGAVSGGRVLAVMFSAALALLLWTVVFVAASNLDWGSVHEARCNGLAASPSVFRREGFPDKPATMLRDQPQRSRGRFQLRPIPSSGLPRSVSRRAMSLEGRSVVSASRRLPG